MILQEKHIQYAGISSQVIPFLINNVPIMK